MKCTNCDGEVAYNQVRCPFCGTENPEAVEFLQSVDKKVKRNKLLGPFLRRVKRPELMLRIVERIAVILLLVNIALVAGCIFFHDFVVKKPAKGSYAKTFVDDFESKHTYHFGNFHSDVDRYLNHEGEGDEFDRYFYDGLFNDAYLAMGRAENEEVRDEYYWFILAFFQGYLHLTEEQCAFLRPADGVYERYADDELWEDALNAVMNNVQEVE